MRMMRRRARGSATVRRTWRLLLGLWSLSILPAVAVEVSLPDTSIGYGAALTLPLTLTNVSPDNIVSVEFEIAEKFDDSIECRGANSLHRPDGSSLQHLIIRL